MNFRSADKVDGWAWAVNDDCPLVLYLRIDSKFITCIRLIDYNKKQEQLLFYTIVHYYCFVMLTFVDYYDIINSNKYQSKF